MEAKKNSAVLSGYASSPDVLRLYSSYSNDNQDIWIKRSEEIIQQFILKLSSFDQFWQAYQFLAERRHQVAVELKQKSEEGKTDYYGTFRGVADHMRKAIYGSDIEQDWKWQKNTIFDLALKLIKPLNDRYSKLTKDVQRYEDESMLCIQQKVIIDEQECTYYRILIKSPYKSSALIMNCDHLSTIELYVFATNPLLNKIKIEYTPLTPHCLTYYYSILNTYYLGLLTWNKEDGIKKFLTASGELTYLLAHLLLVKQGNVGITEWMLRGIAYYRGIDLGYFNHSERISWDFKAIFTPYQEYLNWFNNKAFQGYALLRPGENLKKFIFKKDRKGDIKLAEG